MRQTLSRKGFVYGLSLVILLLTIGLLIPSQGAAGYYNNSSGVVNDDTPENATLDNMIGLFVELSPSIIGTGDQDPSGTGFQGILLVGLVYGTVTVGAMMGTGIGAIGGSILGILTSYGLVDLGYAPAWIKPLLLFGVGVVAFVMFQRIFE